MVLQCFHLELKKSMENVFFNVWEPCNAHNPLFLVLTAKNARQTSLLVQELNTFSLSYAESVERTQSQSKNQCCPPSSGRRSGV